MGKKPDEIQRDIARHRASMNDKAEELRERVHRDVTDARTAVQDRLGEHSNLSAFVEKRPLVTVASALGAGLVAGAVTGRGARSKDHATRTNAGGTSGGGFLAEALSAITGNVGSTLQGELRQAVHDLFERDSRAATAGSQPRTPHFTDHLAGPMRDGEHGGTADMEPLAASSPASTGRTGNTPIPYGNGHGGQN